MNTNKSHFYRATIFVCALLSFFPTTTAQEPQGNKSSLDPAQLALYGSIITAVSAVGGGVVGSVLTFRHNIRIEEFRNKQKQSEERKKEQEFNSKMRSVIRAELESTLDILRTQSDQQVVDLANLSNDLRGIMKYAIDYKNLPVDVRIRLFTIETINLVERAQNGLALMAQHLEVREKDYNRADPTLIGLQGLTERFEDAYKSVMKESL